MFNEMQEHLYRGHTIKQSGWYDEVYQDQFEIQAVFTYECSCGRHWHKEKIVPQQQERKILMSEKITKEDTIAKLVNLIVEKDTEIADLKQRIERDSGYTG